VRSANVSTNATLARTRIALAACRGARETTLRSPPSAINDPLIAKWGAPVTADAAAAEVIDP
jgi:hypothetical protein